MFACCTLHEVNIACTHTPWLTIITQCTFQGTHNYYTMHIPRHTHNYYTMHIPRHTHIKHVIYGPGHIHTYTHVIKWYALRIFNPLSDWALHVCVFTCNYHSHLFMFTCYTQGTQRTNFTSEWEPSCSWGAGQIIAWRAKVSSIGLQAHKLNNILAYNPTWVLRIRILCLYICTEHPLEGLRICKRKQPTFCLVI